METNLCRNARYSEGNRIKLYGAHRALNPRRVKLFLAEKKIDTSNIEFAEVDLKGGENLSSSFLEKNPFGGVPLLQLDDGTYLSESIAICRYFECRNPEPALFGKTPQDQGVVEMWNRRLEQHVLEPIVSAFRHTADFYADRYTQFPDYGAYQKAYAEKIFDLLDKRLKKTLYVAGPDFTVADITAFVAIDFARTIHLRIGDRRFLQRWRELVSERFDSAN